MISKIIEWGLKSVLLYVVFGMGMAAGSAVATFTLWGMGICYM